MSNKNSCIKAEPPSGRLAIIQLKKDVLTEQLNGINIVKRDSSLDDLESAVWGIELIHYSLDVRIRINVVVSDLDSCTYSELVQRVGYSLVDNANHRSVSAEFLGYALAYPVCAACYHGYFVFEHISHTFLSGDE